MKRSGKALAIQPEQALRLVRAEKARRSLYEFVRQAWPLVEPAAAFLDNWHVGAICEHLEAVTRGEITRLCINVPAGHAKSLLVAVLWPAWIWTHRPQWRGLFASYAYDLAERDSVRCRSLIRTDWYGVFMDTGAWDIAPDQDTKGYFVNTRSGFRFSTSVGAQATGWRGDAVIVDDPLSAKEAPSKLAREEAIYWWDKVMSSRLNDMARGARVIIMQRLHEDDLSGHVLAERGYEHLCLPSEFDPQRRSITYHWVPTTPPPAAAPSPGPAAEEPFANLQTPVLLSADVAPAVERREFWRDPRTAEGALLFPALFPTAVLEQAKKDLGSDGYAGQHDQRPTPDGGGRFRTAWWRFWRHDGDSAGTSRRPAGCSDSAARTLPTLDHVVMSLDAAFKATDSSDYVVFQVWGAAEADRFLLHQTRGRMSFTETLATFRRLARDWPDASRKLVEDKANGSAVVSTLEHEIAGIIAVNPEGGKEARAAAVQPQIESGNVYLPEGAPWLDDFVAEFAAFPRGRHDDQVDALSQALLDLGQRELTSAEYIMRMEPATLGHFAWQLASLRYLG